MSRVRSCPVCGRQGLPSGCGSCPQCDADLTCFQALDSLSGPADAEGATGKSRWSRRLPAAVVLLAVVLLALIGLAWSMKSRLRELDRQLAAFKTAEGRLADADGKPGEMAAVSGGQEATSARTEDLARLRAELAASAGKIHIDAQVRILDDRKGTGNPDEASAQAAASVGAGAQGKDGEKAAGTAASAAGAAVMADGRDAAAASGQVGAQKVGRAGDAEGSVAARTGSRPVLKARPKRRIRSARTAGLFKAADAVPAEAPRNIVRQQQSAGLGRTFLYQAKNGDTLWSIAEQFYGSRKYYPVIMEQNPHLLVSGIVVGTVVRLFADRRTAAAFYERRTEQQDGLLLWNHQVRPGETWRTIYARFFPPRYSGMAFYPGNQPVVPGSMVRIILR